MSKNEIRPEKITKPIQLLAAWLTGLIMLVAALLTACANIKTPTWLSAFLGISAVSIIPIFLLLIFLLQTKYRPEMQEDSFYSKYLDKNTQTFKYLQTNEVFRKEREYLEQQIAKISEETKIELSNARDLLITTSNPIPARKTIEKIIQLSDENLETLKQIAKFSTIDLNINKDLSSYTEVVESMKNLGFTNFQEFGKGKVPELFIAAFGEQVPLEIIQQITFALIPEGLQALKRAASGGDFDRNIYLGSLNYAEYKLLGDTLINKLSLIDENTQFSDLFD
jgi:ABC-type multidrug transport system fused ATPase/permease subunit